MAINDEIREHLEDREKETREHVNQFLGRLEDFQPHPRDKNNPHKDNKASIGLGNLDNYPIATEEEMVDSTRDDRFVTPKQADQFWNYHAVDQDISTKIRTPIPQSPLDGSENLDLNPQLQASVYSYNPSTRFPLDYREWQVSVAGAGWDNPVWSYLSQDDLRVTVSTRLDYEKAYVWRCRDVDTEGEMSDWSEEQQFTTANYVLNPLSITKPLDGAAVDRHDYIEWTPKSVADPEGLYSFAQFVLEISRDEAFTDLVKTVNTGWAFHHMTDDLPWETPLFARVKAQFLESDEDSPWSVPIEFTINAYVLEPLSVVYPQDNGRLSPNDTVVVDHKMVSDPEGKYTLKEYQLQVSTTADFTGSVTSLLRDTNRFEMSGVNLTPNTTYYFRTRPLWEETGVVSPWSAAVSAHVFRSDVNFLITYGSRDMIAMTRDDDTGDLFVQHSNRALQDLNDVLITKFNKDGVAQWSRRMVESYNEAERDVIQGSERMFISQGRLHFIYLRHGDIYFATLDPLTGNDLQEVIQEEAASSYQFREISAYTRDSVGNFFLSNRIGASGRPYPPAWIHRLVDQGNPTQSEEIAGGSGGHNEVAITTKMGGSRESRTYAIYSDRSNDTATIVRWNGYNNQIDMNLRLRQFRSRVVGLARRFNSRNGYLLFNELEEVYIIDQPLGGDRSVLDKLTINFSSGSNYFTVRAVRSFGGFVYLLVGMGARENNYQEHSVMLYQSYRVVKIKEDSPAEQFSSVWSKEFGHNTDLIGACHFDVYDNDGEALITIGMTDGRILVMEDSDLVGPLANHPDFYLTDAPSMTIRGNGDNSEAVYSGYFSWGPPHIKDASNPQNTTMQVEPFKPLTRSDF